MDIKEILDLINVLTTIKLNKLNDDLASVILNNIAKCVSYSENFIKVQDQLRKLTIETINVERLIAFETERMRILSLKEEEKVLAEKTFAIEYKDVLEQQNRFVKALNNYLLKKVHIDFEKIDYKMFIKNIKNLGIDITYENLIMLKPMLNNINTDIIEITDNDINELLK